MNIETIQQIYRFLTNVNECHLTADGVSWLALLELSYGLATGGYVEIIWNILHPGDMNNSLFCLQFSFQWVYFSDIFVVVPWRNIQFAIFITLFCLIRSIIQCRCGKWVNQKHFREYRDICYFVCLFHIQPFAARFPPINIPHNITLDFVLGTDFFFICNIIFIIMFLTCLKRIQPIHLKVYMTIIAVKHRYWFCVSFPLFFFFVVVGIIHCLLIITFDYIGIQLSTLNIILYLVDSPGSIQFEYLAANCDDC